MEINKTSESIESIDKSTESIDKKKEKKEKHKKDKKERKERKKKEQQNKTAPPEFKKVINDFVTDIRITFPEYSNIIMSWWNENTDIDSIFRDCFKIYPERFFDILYTNAEIFSDESTVNTMFLPGIQFKQLWKCNISENTRSTIWKYLQLVLFIVVGSVDNNTDLGETTNQLFEAIGSEELKKKLEETMSGMEQLFNDSSNNGTNDGTNDGTNTENTQTNIPNAEHLKDHLNSIMGGKLGKFAMEMAEEVALDLNIDKNNMMDAKNVFQQLFKHPTKMMSIVKKLSSKFNEKIKSGEMKESEIMEESIEFLNKMKDMPGMKNMQQMFSKMGVPMGGGKMNTGAMEAQLKRQMEQAKRKERMREKVTNKNSTNTTNNVTTNQGSSSSMSEEDILLLFASKDNNKKHK